MFLRNLRKMKAALGLRTKADRSVSARIEYWVTRVQYLIGEYSTRPAESGPLKGHSRTNALAWVIALASELEQDARKRSEGEPYDGNMALAADLGMVLATWYACVHRAKSYDMRRPLEVRRDANTRVVQYRGQLEILMSSDVLMGLLFYDQPWNFPFGMGAAGGSFR